MPEISEGSRRICIKSLIFIENYERIIVFNFLKIHKNFRFKFRDIKGIKLKFKRIFRFF
ncbi:hypothetical protein TASI_0890 [Taylorella asinigenitalis MCE3]|uniref:Uncharacterized protein n=1 Tax=Taylorella asinigenitalis (strain MCE3) TaxID=1008459 RepID=G4Q9P3_TAYAM|nr:hypothetical protein TASI_0890 [Taylorella asinigenitalis MCE3]